MQQLWSVPHVIKQISYKVQKKKEIFFFFEDYYSVGHLCIMFKSIINFNIDWGLKLNMHRRHFEAYALFSPPAPWASSCLPVFWMIIWLQCPLCLPFSVHLWPPFVSVCPRRRGQVSACPPSGLTQRATVCPDGQWRWLPPLLPPVMVWRCIGDGSNIRRLDPPASFLLLQQLPTRVNGNNERQESHPSPSCKKNLCTERLQRRVCHKEQMINRWGQIQRQRHTKFQEECVSAIQA